MPNDTQMANIRFGAFDFEDDVLVVAAGKLEGRYAVGCGLTRKEALVNLFENAYPGYKTELGPTAAMHIGELED